LHFFATRGQRGTKYFFEAILESTASTAKQTLYKLAFTERQVHYILFAREIGWRKARLVFKCRVDMDRISINQVSTFRWNFWEDVARYATLGFKGIGVWRHKISDFCDHAVSDSIQTANLRVSSLQWVGGFTGSDGLSFAEALADAQAAIRSAAILRADCLIVHPGSANGHTRSHALRLFHTALDELLPVAEDFGVRLALEPMSATDGESFTFFDRIPLAIDFASRFSPRQLGIVLDLYHFGCDLAVLPTVIDQLDRIALVQLADRRCGHRAESIRCLPGQGSVPLVDWIRALEQAQYRGFYEFEIVGDDGAGSDGFQFLEELARRIPGLFAAATTPPRDRSKRPEPSPGYSSLGRS
jgi:sugar phosphate isomerase/epimerase